MRVWQGAVLLVALAGVSAAAQRGPSGWQVESSPDGRLEVHRDRFGNWSTYQRSEDGRRRINTHYRNGAGRWQEMWIFDQQGERVAEVVQPGASGVADYVNVLRLFGLTPGKPIPGSKIEWESAGEPSHLSLKSPFGTFEHVDLGGADGILRRDTTTVLGRSLSVEVVSTEDDTLLRDNAGGWRTEHYDADALVSARDEYGPIIRMDRDEHGRAVAYWLGEVGVLRFTYEDGTPRWTAKELIDLRDGRVIFRWDTAIPPGAAGPDAESVKSRPGAAIRLFVPGHGSIAEWDPVLYPEGVMVARLGNDPYALVPFDRGLDVVRSLTLFEPFTARGWDRIDYTRDHLFVHMTTDAADSDTAEQTAIIVLPRRSAADEHERIGESASLPSSPGGAGIEPRRQTAKLEVVPCGSENPGCTRITWNSGSSISCPDEGGDTDGDPRWEEGPVALEEAVAVVVTVGAEETAAGAELRRPKEFRWQVDSSPSSFALSRSLSTLWKPGPAAVDSSRIFTVTMVEPSSSLPPTEIGERIPTATEPPPSPLPTG